VAQHTAALWKQARPVHSHLEERWQILATLLILGARAPQLVRSMQTCLEEGLLLYLMWMNVVQNTANHGSSLTAAMQWGCRAVVQLCCSVSCAPSSVARVQEEVGDALQSVAKGAREKG
jgi:hypothetical protein